MLAALTTRTDNTATNVVSDPISSYDSRDVLFSSALSVFISSQYLNRFPSAMDDEIEKRNYHTLLEYVMYNFYVSCLYNQVYGSDLTNLEVLAIFYLSSNIK